MAGVLGRRALRGRATRIFFASDVHGSDPSFRKFVNAARFYDVDVLVFGGDLMGKALVPIVREGGGRYRAELMGSPRVLEGPEEVGAFTRAVETTGFYWAVLDPEEHRAAREDPAVVDRLFEDLARERLAAWMALAEERLAGSGVRCFLTGGNDDWPAVLTLLEERSTERVVACEAGPVPLDDHHWMVTVGYSTPTPWGTPREATEEQIAAAIDARVAAVPDPSRCVFNLHVPPLDSGLDRCLRLDPSTDPPSPVRQGGQPVFHGAGSRAVREAILAYQPAVSLHGHIHESPGRARYGRTPCFTPGSEHGQGVLRGVVLALRDGRVAGFQFTSG